MTKNELYEKFAGEEMGDKELIAKPATTLLINEEGSFSAQTLDKHLMRRTLSPTCGDADAPMQTGCAACPAVCSANTLQAGHQAHGTTPIPSPREYLPALPF